MGFMLVLEAGIDLSEIDLAARLYTESLDVVHGDYLRCFLVGNTAAPGTPRSRWYLFIPGTAQFRPLVHFFRY